jgi:hypothetical protein
MPRLILKLVAVVSLLVCAAAVDHAGASGSHHPAPETMAVFGGEPMVLAAAEHAAGEDGHTHAAPHEQHPAHACDQPATAPQPAWIVAELAPVAVLPLPGDAGRPARGDGCEPAPPSLLLMTCVCRR